MEGKWLGCTLLSLFSSTPPHHHNWSRQYSCIQLHNNASAAISTVFCLSLSYQKWLVQQWLVVGGVNGSSWHSGRSWHLETAANQAMTRFRLSQNKYTVRVPDRLQLQQGKLIWSKLVAHWSNLEGSITDKYKAEVTGVCEASVVGPHLKFTTLSWLFSPAIYFPFENEIKKYVLRFACGVHLCEHHRSLAEAKWGPLGEGQGSTYGKWIEGGRPEGTRPPSFAAGKTSVTRRTIWPH